MKAISDSTPLIHLARVRKIHYLGNLFNEIIISEEIYKEVINKGEEQSRTEVNLIKKLIEEKLITKKEANNIMEIPNLHKGEKEALSLCKELKISNLLIDDKEGFNSAIMLGLTPIRTTTIFIILLDKKIIDFNEYKESLQRLSESGYFLDALTYERLLKIGKGIIESQT